MGGHDLGGAIFRLAGASHPARRRQAHDDRPALWARNHLRPGQRAGDPAGQLAARLRRRTRRPRRHPLAQRPRILRPAVRLRQDRRHHAAAQLAPGGAGAGIHHRRFRAQGSDPRRLVPGPGRRAEEALPDRDPALHRRRAARQRLRKGAGQPEGRDRGRRADARRLLDDHVHLGHHRPSQGLDHDLRNEFLQLRQSRQPGAGQPELGASGNLAAVPYRRTELLRQSDLPCRRHGADHAHLRSRQMP